MKISSPYIGQIKSLSACSLKSKGVADSTNYLGFSACQVEKLPGNIFRCKCCGRWEYSHRQAFVLNDGAVTPGLSHMHVTII